MSNQGKAFEQDFYKSCQVPGLSIDRFYDVTNGRAGVNTLCDFVVYHFPQQFYFELKSYQVNSIPIKGLRPNQLSGLAEKAAIMGVYAGFLLNYRSEKLGDKTFFLTIGTVQTLIKNGYKSISRETAADLGYEVEATKKITRYTYDIKALMRAVVAGEYIPYK